MATENQIASNRDNAQLSTGPRTQEGKNASRFNALKHGLLSKHILLSDEDRDAYSTFASELRDQLRPETQIEEVLVDRIITSAWRLRRVVRVETRLFSDLREDTDHTGILTEDRGLGHAFIKGGYESDCFSKLSRYEITLERGMMRALHELQRIQAVRRGESALAPVAIDVDIAAQSD